MFLVCITTKSFATYYESNLELHLYDGKFEQDRTTISGIVKDKESGETLPFANVFVKDTNIGTTTNADGFFTLFDIPSETSTIQVQYLGYKVKTLVLTPEMVIASNGPSVTMTNFLVQSCESILNT